MSTYKAVKDPNGEIYKSRGFVHTRLVIAIVLVFGFGVGFLLSNRLSERAKKEQGYLVAESQQLLGTESEKEATSSGEDKVEEGLPKSKPPAEPEIAPTPAADPEPAQDKVEFDVHKDTSPAAMIGVDRYSCSVGEEFAFDGSSSFGFHGALASYEWSFGDGTKSSGVKTSHSYNESGDYEISLTVRDGTNGKIDAATIFVTVNPPPFTGEDNEKPIFSGLELGANGVRKGGTITVYVYATDKDSGLRDGDMRAVDGTGDLDVRADNHCNKVSDNKLRCDLEIPQYATAGIWHISHVNINDVAGRQLHVSFGDSEYTFTVEP